MLSSDNTTLNKKHDAHLQGVDSLLGEQEIVAKCDKSTMIGKIQSSMKI